MFHLIVLKTMKIMEPFGGVLAGRRKKNYGHNVALIGRHIPRTYIEDQRNWKDIRFGWKNMAYSGCEILAVYNAMFWLQKRFGSEALLSDISYFEKHGALLQGVFGTSPYAIRQYFLEKGYQVKMLTKDQKFEIQRIASCEDVFILTAFNQGYNLFKQIHTVCITKEESGKYHVHNAYALNSHRKYVAMEFDSLESAIHGFHEGSKLICLQAIFR